MNECQRIHEMMVDALYGELDDGKKAILHTHLKSCRDCAGLYQRLTRTIGVMNARETSERDEVFWAGYSERLAERLESQEYRGKASFRKRLFFERFTWHNHPFLRVGAVAALVLIGIFLGKWIWTEEHQARPKPQAFVSTTRQTDALPVLLEDRAESCLQKSKLLLLALANFDPQTDDKATLNLQNQRHISETLVQEAAYLKTALEDPAETRLRELISDLEIILLQIANLEDEYDLEAVEMIQKGVDKRSILFRIDLSEISRETSEASSRIESKTQDKHKT
jgi:hypothetical protein